MAFGKKIDPALAKQIEEDMAELDNEQPKPQSKAGTFVDCPDCNGTGLTAEGQICPTCEGSGKVLG